VLDTAVRLALGQKADLVLFRAIGIPIEIPPEAYSMQPTSLGEMLEKGAQTYLEGVAKTLPPEVHATVRVAIGTPWQAVCEAAKAENVDLIVIGSHGYDALDHIIGTTAGRVVNHADRSVLVVRSPERLAT
jgi:nucleotide-binding universal stress UspA family protein